MHPSSVRLLGGINLMNNGDAIHLGPSRERECFGALVVRRGTPVSVDQLVDDLWGPTAPARAENVVHTYISRLRRRIGAASTGTGAAGTSDGALVRSLRPGYSVDRELVSVDVDQFESDRRSGITAMHTGDLERARTLIDRSLTLWSGHTALHGAVGPLAARERRRLDELRMDTTELALALRMHTGNPGDSVADLYALTTQHPYRESLWMLLMLGLALGERRGNALIAFHELRVHLDRELGIKPSARALRLYTDMLTDLTAAELWERHFRLPNLDRADGWLQSTPDRPNRFRGGHAA